MNSRDDLALREVYGRRYAIGPDDQLQFRTYQFRNSNVKRLPREMFDRLRRAFEGCDGIFILGCASGVERPGSELELFPAALARLLRVRVWAAGDYTKFYTPIAMSTWRVVLGTNRGSTTTDPVILLPAPLGAARIQSIQEDPADILEIFRNHFRLFEPGPESER